MYAEHRCPHCGECLAPRPNEILRLSTITFDTGTCELMVNGEIRRISAGKETAILTAMLRSPGRIFTRDNLENIAETWDVSPNALSVLLHGVRRAVAGAAQLKWFPKVGWSLFPLEESVDVR